MMRLIALSFALFLGGPVLAQEVQSGSGDALPPNDAATQEVQSGTGAVLRGLDRVSGEVQDIPIKSGETVGYGKLEITLSDCRYPVGNPAGDAFAHLTIRDLVAGDVAFDGWMIASSPALNALDHPRYDVWVIRCNTSKG